MTTQIAAKPILQTDAKLGESPRWDDRTGSLLWVDIEQSRVHRFNVTTGRDSYIEIAAQPGAVLLGTLGELIVPIPGSLCTVNESTGKLTPIASISDSDGNRRCNDASVDALGRVWVGVIGDTHDASDGSLHVIDIDGSDRVVLSGLKLANGLDWSPDGNKFFFIDSYEEAVLCFDLNLELGMLSNPVRRLEIGAFAPDGLCVDADGNIWVAIWSHSEIRCLTPDGELRFVVKVPVPHVTSCTFGGHDLKTLFITTAGGNESGSLDGSLFACQPGVVGQPTRRVSIKSMKEQV